MKSVKCPECGFVGWADAERCKKCDVVRMPDHDPDLPDRSYQSTPANLHYQPGDQGYVHGELKKGLAVTSLVIGILDLFTLGLLGVGVVAGIVLAIVALNKAKRNPYEYGGQSLATAGLVMSIISAVLLVPFGIVAAIAVPNLLAARRAANEASTLRVLREIDSAQFTYQATHASGQYGTLDQLIADELLGPELASGSHYGYKFTITIKEGGTGYTSPRFQAVAVPLTYGSTGIRSFYLDETGVIRAGDNRGAVATELNDPLNADGYSSSSPPLKKIYIDENGVYSR